jgi:hypothetical protein
VHFPTSGVDIQHLPTPGVDIQHFPTPGVDIRHFPTPGGRHTKLPDIRCRHTTLPDTSVCDENHSPLVTVIAGHIDEHDDFTHVDNVPIFYIGAPSTSNSCIWHAHIPDPLNGGSPSHRY